MKVDWTVVTSVVVAMLIMGTASYFLAKAMGIKTVAR